MDNEAELEQWMALIHSSNPSLRDINRFVGALRPRHNLLNLTPEARADCLTRLLATLPRPDPDAVSADCRWLDQSPDHRFVPITDNRYPWLLRQIPDPPLALYASGNTDCLNQPCLAIVGSRNPTPQGRETATSFARRLAGMGFTVVSGLARGIDGCAHRGALEAGRTAAVCGNGLDVVYPHAHRSLAAAIGDGSVLVSEFPVGIGPKRHHFPRRNRIISAMCLGTLVVEAGLRSGSLITANLAGEQNREVFAVPGPITAPQSRGCHDLIRRGVTLVETVDDILRELGHYSGFSCDANGFTSNRDNANAWFLEHMGYAPCTRDELVRRSGLTSGEVSSMLLKLELEGCVELCPGGTYVRVTRS